MQRTQHWTWRATGKFRMNAPLQKHEAVWPTWRLCFDGARRESGKSAAGMALLAYYPGGRQNILHRSGKVLGILNSAFLAEMLALEWALEQVTIIMGW